MNTSCRALVAGIGLLLLSACVTVTPNFSAKPEFWSEKDKIIGVAIEQPPKPTAFKVGNQGLLDVAINQANASKLETHLNGLDTSKISELADRVAAYLRQKGFMVKRIAEPIRVDTLAILENKNNDAQNGYIMADRDYTPLKQKYGVDKIVMLSIVRMGTIRNYYGFIPLGEPSGMCNLSGKVVNLNDNHLEWNQAVAQTTPNSDGPWDVPPDFPGLTKAVYGAFDQSRNTLYNDFAQ